MGKKEKKNKSQRNEKNKHKFPEPLLKKLEEAGLDTKNLIFCCTGDMDNDACYRSAWLSFDEKGLYVAYGTEKLVKAKHQATRLNKSLQFPLTTSIRLKPSDTFQQADSSRSKTVNSKALFAFPSVSWVSLTT